MNRPAKVNINLLYESLNSANSSSFFQGTNKG